MIEVHHLEHSRSQRVIWLLERLNQEYVVKRYDRDSATGLAPPELKAVHPLGKSPVIVDHGKVIAETGLIIEYLIHTYGSDDWRFELGSDEAWQERYWLHYCEGSLMPFLVMKRVFDAVEDKPAPFFVKPIVKKICSGVVGSFIKPNIHTHLDFIENALEGKQWFVGDRISAADIQMIFPLEAVFGRMPGLKHYSNIQAYVQRIHSDPAYQAALKTGGPYAYASLSQT